MNNSPRANRIHISIFGKRNVGKSSLINALTNQNIALVSNIKGTTTDPVYKSMELLPIGPVVFIDTAGIDDEGELGKLRVEKTLKIIDKTDIAIILLSFESDNIEYEKKLISLLKKKDIPFIGVLNKIDINNRDIEKLNKNLDLDIIKISTKTKSGIKGLKRRLETLVKDLEKEKNFIIKDKVKRNDIIVQVTPIDESAPKGRLILPQVQTIRDVLDASGINIVVKETELKKTIELFGDKIKLVITDSQVFGKIKNIVPEDILLTSYSILFARYKGELLEFVRGIKKIKELKEGNLILISEACTHHRQKGDIGKDKIPRFLEEISGEKLTFNWSSGSSIPEKISKYNMIVHCGACMINRKEMISRIERAKERNIPIINYGIFLAYKHSILERALEIFPEVRKELY